MKLLHSSSTTADPNAVIGKKRPSAVAISLLPIPSTVTWCRRLDPGWIHFRASLSTVSSQESRLENIMYIRCILEKIGPGFRSSILHINADCLVRESRRSSHAFRELVGGPFPYGCWVDQTHHRLVGAIVLPGFTLTLHVGTIYTIWGPM